MNTTAWRVGLAWIGSVVIFTACGDNWAVTSDAAIADDAAADAPQDAALAALDAPDAMGSATTGPCNVLVQTGCAGSQKCTWLIDALNPSYVGHVGCAPAGTAGEGSSCMYGAPGSSGYDNCAKGLVCGDYRGGTGTCKTICDQQGGVPSCDASHACVTYSGLFSTSSTTPAAGGMCDDACNPLTDNDFDGSGSASSKSTGTCSGSATLGCYGFPSYGTPPATAWSCAPDINYFTNQPVGVRHRVACTEANGCADPGPTVYVNSCNQGYLPLLYEQSGSTTIICVAMCKPAICYSGNCGVNNTNRNGDPTSGHQCNDIDRVGSFASTEQCQYAWWREVDDSGNFLPSPTSDSVGYCMDLAKYRYDSNGDNVLNTSDSVLPNCDALGSGFGSGSDRSMPTTFFGGADLGCVPSSYLPPTAIGKGGLSPAALQKRAALNLPRSLYHRTAR